MTFLPAKQKGDLVLCGEPTCPAVLGKMRGTFLTLTLGLVEVRDAQGKPTEPPVYAEPVDVRRRRSTAAHTKKRISLFRRNLSNERFADLARMEVWVKCPRRCKPITVVGLPK